jgi:thiamine kinase-like enzyme
MAKSKDFPPDPNSITPFWLTQVLRNARVIKNTTIKSFIKSRIGEDEGFTGGNLIRFEINYAPLEKEAPRSLIAKFSPTDPELRAIFRAVNSREVHFYTELASQSDLPVPRCYYGDFDAETGASILLLQDLSHFQAVELITGCEPEDVEHVVRALAKVHSHWWNSPQLTEMSGVSILAEFPFSELWSQYPQKVGELLPDMLIPDSFFAIGRHIAANVLSIFNQLYETNPITCIHRDIHLDNVLFGRQSSDVPVLLLDWQGVGKGRGVYDVAYFLISSVPSAQRRQTEKDLLSIYHTLLVQSGIKNYSFEQCWFDYKLSVVGKLYVTVLATVLLDNSGAHKRAWRQADLQRLLAFCKDHSVNDLLLSIESR